MAKFQKQDTKTLLTDSRVDVQNIKSVKYISTPTLETKLKSNDYILEDGVIYVLKSDGSVRLGDGENTWTSSTSLGSGKPTGADVAITGYTIGTASALSATDTINQALGKLEARVVALETPTP